MSRIEYQAPLQMYNIVGREVLQYPSNASIDVQTRIRETMRPQWCNRSFDGQMPFPTTPRLHYEGGFLPAQFPTATRVERLEQRNVGTLYHTAPIAQVQSHIPFDIQNDPLRQVKLDDLSARQTTAMLVSL